MVVVQNGKPVKVGGSASEAAVDEEDDDAEDARFSTLEKKVRALQEGLARGPPSYIS